MCKVEPYYYVKLEIYFQNMTPCFKWTSNIEKKFLEFFIEFTIFVKYEKPNNNCTS